MMFYIHYALEVIGILSAVLTAIGHMTFLPLTWQTRALALGANIGLFVRSVRPKSAVAQTVTDPELLKLAELIGKKNWTLPARGVIESKFSPESYSENNTIITEKPFDPEETLDSPK